MYYMSLVSDMKYNDILKTSISTMHTSYTGTHYRHSIDRDTAPLIVE